MIHEGVELALDEIWDKLLHRITKTLYGQKIMLSGHSLGGALAQLTCMRLLELGVPVTNLCTFGAPALGDQKFSQRFQAKFHKRFFRIVNEGDSVPDFPTEKMGYYHSGIGLEFNKKNQLLPVQSPEGFWESLMELFEVNQNHSMDIYLKKCLTYLERGS